MIRTVSAAAVCLGLLGLLENYYLPIRGYGLIFSIVGSSLAVLFGTYVLWAETRKQKNIKELFAPYDSADYLTSEEDIAAYLAATHETNDGVLVKTALQMWSERGLE